MFTDIHTHILHNIDDGPKNFEQSVELLNKAVQNGIRNIVATPHFYAERHSLNERLNNAKERFEQLNAYIIQKQMDVSLLKGFEVKYFDGISRIDSLNEMSINGSGVLLLELGHTRITENITDEILNMSYSGYTVVLAHIERYTKVPGFKLIKRLINDGEVVPQCNASSFLSAPFQRAAYRLLKEDMVSVIASDMHSVDMRPPTLKEAYSLIENKFGASVKKQLVYQAEELFAHCIN